jgi:hypothetical protein
MTIHRTFMIAGLFIVFAARAPLATSMQWASTQLTCAIATTGGRWGWRQPTLAELQSLLDPTATPTRLPPNHPFNVSGDAPLFWSQTLAVGSTAHFAVGVNDGGLYQYANTPDIQLRVWCVRGGIATSQ